MSKSIFGVASAAFLDVSTKEPLIKTNLITACALNVTGELIPRSGGNMQFNLESFQNMTDAQIQLTIKDWHPTIYDIALGSESERVALTNANIATVEEISVDASDITLAAESDATKAALAINGKFLLRFDGTDWKLFILEDQRRSQIYDVDSLQVGGDLTLSTAASSLGNGFTAALDAGYTPAEGDYVIFSTFIAGGGETYVTRLQEGKLRPYVGIVLAAEMQGDYFNIYAPRAKCSSGVPFAMNERADNEYQLTFDLSLPPGGNELLRIVHQLRND